MTTVVGGLRGRLIVDSYRKMLRDSLDALGWFDSGRQHRPITFVSNEYKVDEEVPLNTIVVADSDVTDEPAEMGSVLADDTWTIYVDFYAEDDSLGRHLMGDFRDISRGKMPSIDRTGPVFNVLSLHEPTPTTLFVCQITDVTVDKANNFPHPWQQHWWVGRVTIEDTYATELDE